MPSTKRTRPDRRCSRKEDSDQITRAMESINQGATQTQKGMQQVDRAAQNLNDLARQLTGIAQTYELG